MATSRLIRQMKTAYLDQNCWREPKTDFYCYVCQKDIKPVSLYRMVHVVLGGNYALHPDDEADYVGDGGDLGLHPIGPACAKKLGLEWTHKGGLK